MVRWFNSMVIVVLLSTTSTITMVGSRILAAMAKDGQLPSTVAKLNKNDVPERPVDSGHHHGDLYPRCK